MRREGGHTKEGERGKRHGCGAGGGRGDRSYEDEDGGTGRRSRPPESPAASSVITLHPLPSANQEAQRTPQGSHLSLQGATSASRKPGPQGSDIHPPAGHQGVPSSPGGTQR